MSKRKIIKLEINKEDILNLSQDESQKVIGGGGAVTVDYSQCPATGCENDSDGCGSTDCTDEDCTYGDCTMNDTDATDCDRTFVGYCERT